MKIAVVTIGDEILTGFTLNTNAAWIGQQLLKIGAEVNTQLTISDNREEIIKYLEYLDFNNHSIQYSRTLPVSIRHISDAKH